MSASDDMPLVCLAKPNVKAQPKQKAKGKPKAESEGLKSEFDKALHDQQIELFEEALFKEQKEKKEAEDKLLVAEQKKLAEMIGILFY